MEPKQNRSIGLIIRRFFAIFILISTASGIVAQIETGTFTNETFGSAFVSFLIAYYLARSPRNKTQSSDVGVDIAHTWPDCVGFWFGAPVYEDSSRS